MDQQRTGSGSSEAPDITATLAERGDKYGDFREVSRVTQNLKCAMRDSPNWAVLPPYLREGLEMTQHKIGRLLNGDPLYDDNLHDIIGYVRLMQDRAAQDREAGRVIVSGGDPLYPAYKQEPRDPEFHKNDPRDYFAQKQKEQQG